MTSDSSPHTSQDSSISSFTISGSGTAAGTKTVEEVVIVDGVPVKIRKQAQVQGFHPSLLRAAKRQVSFNKPVDAKYLETSSYLAMVNSFNSHQIMTDFNRMKETDWDNNDLGPRGLYSALVLNTFLDTVDNITGAGLKDPETYARALRQGEGLMKEMRMSSSDIEEYLDRHHEDLQHEAA